MVEWKDGVWPSTSSGVAPWSWACVTMASSRLRSKTPGDVSREGQ